MNWPRVATAAVALLSLWVLAADVVTGFPRSRVKLVTTPLPATLRVSLPLSSAARIPGEQLVLVCRVRNTGTTPVTITARLGDRVLRHAAVPAGDSRRLDLAWPRAASRVETTAVDLAGTSSAWTLDYAELANLHGFTRGALELLVLPATQPFTRPHPWAMLLLAAWSALVLAVRPAPWPRWARAAHGVLALLFAALLVLTAISPWLSPYRIALSVHSFVLALAVIWLRPILHALGVTLRSSSLLTRADPRTTRLLAAIGLGVVAVAYVTLLWLHMGAYAGASDSSGYMNHARLLAERHVSTPIRRVPGLPDTVLPQSAYVPLGFRPHGAGAIAPTYPMGLPLLVAAAARALGWVRAPAAVMLLHALLGVVLIALLARACGLPWPIAVLAAILLASSPLYLFMSVHLMSDTPALVWTSLAMVLCARAGPERHRAWRDLLAGVAMSIAVLVRPTNILVLLPLAICLGTAWRRWICVVAGGVPGAALLLAFNVAAYGSAITTGYGDTTAAFTVENVAPSLRNYVTWLPVLLTPIGLLAVGLPAMVRRHGRLAVVLITWACSFLVFYAFYYHTHEWWWYLRFLLPAFPPLLVGALWVGVSAWTRWRRAPPGGRGARVAWAALAAFVVVHNAFWIERLGALQSGHRERIYVELTSWAASHMPADASVLTMQASGAFQYYTPFPIVRWDQCDRAALERLEAHVLDTGRTLYAVLFPFEIEEQRAFDRIPGMWSRVGRVQDITIWRLVATDDELSTSPIVGIHR